MIARHVQVGSRWHVDTGRVVIGLAHLPPPARIDEDAPRIQALLLAPPRPPLHVRLWRYLTQPVR